jgi:hypothetical protein
MTKTQISKPLWVRPSAHRLPAASTVVVSRAEPLVRTAPNSAGVLDFHPLSNIFPMRTESEINQLAEDIKSHGQISPICLFQGKIIEGRALALACERAGVKARSEVYSGNDPLGRILSGNGLRRQLTTSQRVMAAARAADCEVGSNQHSGGLPIDRAAALLGVGVRSVNRAKQVLAAGVGELVAAVDAGTISISAAERISKLGPEKQHEAILAKSLSAQTRKRRPKTSAGNSSRELSTATSVDKNSSDDRASRPGDSVVETLAVDPSLLRLTPVDQAILDQLIAVTAPLMASASEAVIRSFIARMEDQIKGATTMVQPR